MDENVRSSRPLGLSVMVLMCMALYVILPLLGVAYPILLALRVRPAGGDSGAELSGGAVVQVILSLAFAVVLVLAWVGRPPRIRWVLTGLVLIQAALVTVNGLIVLSQPAGWDSMADLQRSTQPILIPSAVGMGLFVIWYFNRAPAVAFFTGEPIAYIEDEARAAESDVTT